MPIVVVFGIALLLVLWFLGQPWLKAYRRKRWQQPPFPEAWRKILRKRVPYVRLLPVDLQQQLKKHIQVFLAEKPIIGCGGLHITDEIRVTIAAQACLLILNRPTNYFPQLRQILVYPGAFVVDRSFTDGSGVYQEHRRVLSGEAWSQGQVILSWQDTVEGAAVVNDAQNVVIHEFAHQLDMETGAANGAPHLGVRARYERWSRTMQAEFNALQAQARRQEPSLLSHYGATDPAEFFAVLTETFFEKPAELAQQHPQLYQECREYYRLDPLSWR